MNRYFESNASLQFKQLDMSSIYNCSIESLDEYTCSKRILEMKERFPSGKCIFMGIPFLLGQRGNKNNILLLKDVPKTIKLDTVCSDRYIVFLHTADFKTNTANDDGIFRPMMGEPLLGEIVADYVLKYTDGSEYAIPIKRRFNIGEPDMRWGANSFEAVPNSKPYAIRTASEDIISGRRPCIEWGRSQFRVLGANRAGPPYCWLYALENPHTDKLLQEIEIIPKNGVVLLFAINLSNHESNPLRWERRKRIVVKLPEGEEPELNGYYDKVDIDLGAVISTSKVADYDDKNWQYTYINKQPSSLSNFIMIEYTAHRDANLYLGNEFKYRIPFSEITGIYGEDITDALSHIPGEGFKVNSLPDADQKVKFKITDGKSGKPVPVKIHLHSVAGEYLTPINRHRIPNPFWFEDYSTDFVQGRHFSTYINGYAEFRLPIGNVYVEISKGFEIVPIRKKLTIGKNTSNINMELEHVLPWRENGWVTADTHVHFLSPQTALLEGEAEGVNVVNLLASQWGELFTNVGDFDGKTTIGSRESGGSGEFLVRVGTENRQHILGHISLIGYEGNMILPLTSGGPDESALGDAVEKTLTEWAEQCRKQNGIVILPHFPEPRVEGAAVIVKNLADGIEMTSWGNLYGGISPYSLSDWYRYLNCGYHIAAVGGTDKMSADTAVGAIRTYAWIGDKPFTYEIWKEAIRKGNTFVTYGPLLEFSINGKSMGSCIKLPSTGGTLDVEWEVATVTIPVTKVDLVVNGETRDEKIVDAGKRNHKGSFHIKVDESVWIALRIKGQYPGKPEMIAAHSSAVVALIAGKPLFNHLDAVTILEQIEGATAYVNTLGIRAEEKVYKKLLLKLTSAYRELHHRMHGNGMYHKHNAVVDHHK